MSDMERTLFIRCQNGDQGALNILMKKYQRLVHQFALKYANNGSYDDNFQNGNIGLIKAIKDFDLSINIKFSTYAITKIKREIMCGKVELIPGFRNNVYTYRMSRQLENYKNKFKEKNKRYPTEKEILRDLSWNLKTYNAINNINASIYSTYTSIYNDTDDLTINDTISYNNISVENDVISKIIVDEIFGIMEKYVSKKNMDIFKLYYGFVDGIEHEQKEIAEMYNMTQQGVSSNIINVIKKTKKPILDYLNSK